MKIIVAKTLIETNDGNYCRTELFRSMKAAQEWAGKDIDLYNEEYCDGDGTVTKSPIIYSLSDPERGLHINTELETNEI